MKKEMIESIKKIRNFEELLTAKYGEIGTSTRNEFEEGSQRFYISEMLKHARLEAQLTQSELAEKIGTKKSYISKVENGKSNITIETLIRIFETGLNRRIGITIS